MILTSKDLKSLLIENPQNSIEILTYILGLILDQDDIEIIIDEDKYESLLD